MKAVRAPFETFDSILEEALNNGNTVYVVFFGNEQPETNESWCPDCVVADPLIRKALLAHAPADTLLIEAPVGQRQDWRGNPDHPYRTRFSLTAVPTLVRWTQDGPGAQLVELDCSDEQKLEAFIRSSSSQ